MEMISFPEQTVVIAKDQPEYKPLPAYQFKDRRGRIVCCWSLTLRERLKLLWTGRLWHQVLTFNQPLQPQLLDADAQAREILDGCAKWGKQTGLYDTLVEAIAAALTQARREAWEEALELARKHHHMQLLPILEARARGERSYREARGCSPPESDLSPESAIRRLRDGEQALSQQGEKGQVRGDMDALPQP